MATSDKYKHDLSLVKKLIKIVEASDVNEIELEEEGVRIRVSKSNQTQAVQQVPVQQVTIPQTKQNVEVQANVQTPVTAPEVKNNLHEIKSPIVGTFYRSPSPDSPSFVEVGKIVEKGEVLCIVEAMKLMNEIQSDISGKIVKILVENGKPVEYNQPLFVVEV